MTLGVSALIENMASILGFAAAGESMSPAKAVGYVLILLSLILYNT